MNTAEVAAKLGCDKETLRQAIKEGKIPFAVAVKYASGKYSFLYFPKKAKEYIEGLD